MSKRKKLNLSIQGVRKKRFSDWLGKQYNLLRSQSGGRIRANCRKVIIPV